MLDLREMKEDFAALPSWGRMVIYLILALGIIKWFPLVELLKLSIYVVLVPLGAYHGLKYLGSSFGEEVKSFFSGKDNEVQEAEVVGDE
jgi:hypothetical protein